MSALFHLACLPSMSRMRKMQGNGAVLNDGLFWLGNPTLRKRLICQMFLQPVRVTKTCGPEKVYTVTRDENYRRKMAPNSRKSVTFYVPPTWLIVSVCDALYIQVVVHCDTVSGHSR